MFHRSFPPHRLTLLGLLVISLLLPIVVHSRETVLHTETGKATWYGPGFHGRLTASGKPFNKYAMVAAHPELPLGSVARVTNLRNGRSVEVAVIDRGPARSAQRRGVIIDLSQGAAQQLGYIRDGKVPVKVEVLQWGNRRGT